MLSGRAIRVADGDPDGLRTILSAAWLDATVERVPATIEERMAVLARGGGAA
jgi:ABC-2 type transport system ATP-binding protein/ribosome-dependent ATPase